MSCCVQCEIIKAKNAIKMMLPCITGNGVAEHIAKVLSDRFHISYYVESNTLYRANEVAPYTPYEVWVF